MSGATEHGILDVWYLVTQNPGRPVLCVNWNPRCPVVRSMGYRMSGQGVVKVDWEALFVEVHMDGRRVASMIL